MLAKIASVVIIAVVLTVLTGCRPRPAPSVCVDFEPPLVVGAQYGGPVGNIPGNVVFTIHTIPVSVYAFIFMNAGGTFNLAKIDLPSLPFGKGQSIQTNNINLEFNFTGLVFQTSQVNLEFLDLGGFENISINGSPIFAGELSAAPRVIAGVSLLVTTVAVQGGKKGTVTLMGPLQKVRIGGQEFWIDEVCASN